MQKEQKKIIHKVHKQVGHHTKKKMREALMNSSIKWEMKKLGEELTWLEENCEGCILKKRTPCKPAASIPLAGRFNEIVGMDLKIYGDVIISDP